ncbi:hypothetical protein CPAV1605_1419 [seawater metagenome]|uniref:Uncharacterized protein n=1 Tax=seawater metagenome TaxID=1561972 RepID=A0A5E8CM58_9ZZZZ
MKRYQVYKEESLLKDIFIKKGGATARSSDFGLDLGLDLTSLFNSNRAVSESSTPSLQSEEDLIVFPPADPTLLAKMPLRTSSAPASFSSLKGPPKLKRTLSAESKPQAVNSKLVTGYGTTEGEINLNLSALIENLIGIKIQVNIIPVISDGSCGLSSIITLLKGRVPSTREVYDEREKIGLDTAPLPEVLITACHGESLEARFLINYVKEYLQINLCVINERIIIVPTELDGKNIMFMVGDGVHYNPLEINDLATIPNYDAFYRAIVDAPKVADEEISFIFQ